MKPYTVLTLPFRPLPELRQEIEAFLYLLCEEAGREQQLNKLRPQALNMRTLEPIAWVNLLEISACWRSKRLLYFGLRVPDPCSDHPDDQWALFGTVEKLKHCACDKRAAQGQGAAVTGKECAEGAAECKRCRYRVSFHLSPSFAFSVYEVLAAFDHYLCHDEQLAPGLAAPLPLDPEQDGFALLEQPLKEEKEADGVAPAARTGPLGGRAVLASSVQLEQWMRSLENTREYDRFFEAWTQLRRQEPGFEDILDLGGAFKKVAERCRDRIHSGTHGD